MSDYILNSRVKQFCEYRYARLQDGNWVFNGPDMPAPSEAMDEQINRWLTETGNQLISVGTPGVFAFWYDKDHTIKVITIVAIIIYRSPDLMVEEIANESEQSREPVDEWYNQYGTEH